MNFNKSEKPKRPNILLYFTDQQRHDTIGAYGQPLDITANLDKLAKEGAIFTRAFTCQPVCGPARACLQSGEYATQIGCFINGIKYPENKPTLAHHFNSNGYETAYIGKWHLASSMPEENYMYKAVPKELQGGYKYWRASDILEYTSNGYEGYIYDENENRIDFSGFRADKITDFAIEYLDNYASENPFFLTLSHIEPHHQNNVKKVQGPIGSKEKFKGAIAPNDLLPGVGDWEENYPDYLGCVESLDQNLGRVLDALKRNKMYDNTVIFFFSDHGCHFKTREGEYKRSCHDSSIHIPLVIHGGEFTGRGEIESVVSLMNLPATILSCSGIEVPDTMAEPPLQKLLSENPKWEEMAFIQISESQVGRAIRTKRWTYSIYAPDRHKTQDSYSVKYQSQFLYDNETDPAQQNNLVNNEKYKNILEEMKILIKSKILKVENIDVAID